jgi:diguanylate cyclase (GGDEF)-like protein
MERLEFESARAARYEEPLTLILFDVDRMTHVNETHGQDMGDEVLRRVAEVVKEQIRTSDIAGRYSGEEFMILCPNTERPSAQFLAERLRRRVAELSFTTEEEEFGVTISVGLVTVTSQNEFDIEAILGASEQALESAKTGGMNRVRVLEVI